MKNQYAQSWISLDRKNESGVIVVCRQYQLLIGVLSGTYDMVQYSAPPGVYHVFMAGCTGTQGYRKRDSPRCLPLLPPPPPRLRYDGATEAAILRCARLALGLGLDPDLDPEESPRLVWKTGDAVDFGQPVTNGVTLYLDTAIAPPRDSVYGGYGGSDGYDGYDGYGGYAGSVNTPRLPFGEGGGGGGGDDVIARDRSSATRVRSRTKDQDQERSGWEGNPSSRSVPSSSPAIVRGSGRGGASGSGGGSSSSSGGDNRHRSDSKSDAPKTLIRRWLRRRLDSSTRGGSGGGSGTGVNPPVDLNSSDEERRPLLNATTRSPPSRRDQPAAANKGDWGCGWGWGRGGGGERSWSSSSSSSSLLARCRGAGREVGPSEVDGDGDGGEQQRRAILKLKRMNAHLANERTFLAWIRATAKMFTAGVLSLALAAETTGSYPVVFVAVSLVYFALCPYIVFIANNRFDLRTVV